ncbi:MAG: hypothetical protein H6618_07170 [Deltaproteobacteria bacterium]|nr:hypothetical protein [Deltaproteobacteria bacterium]
MESEHILAGDACPGEEMPQNMSGPALLHHASKRWNLWLVVMCGALAGLALGSGMAMLLISGDLNLSLTEVRALISEIRSLIPETF